MTTLGRNLEVLASRYRWRFRARGYLELGSYERMLLLLLLPGGLIAACFGVYARPGPLLYIIGGGQVFEGVHMLGGMARRRVSSRGAGGLGFLLILVQCISAFGFLAFFFFFKLLLLQALSFGIVGLALEDPSAN